MITNYNPTNPERVHPEFVGIAQKCSSVKKNRTSLEQKRNTLLRNLKYKMSVDRQLQQTLQQKRQRLRSVRGVHSRHRNDIETKQQLSERKRIHMLQLNHTIQFTREQDTRNIKNALNSTLQKNKRARQEHERILEQMREQMRATRQSAFEEKRNKYNQVKLGKRISVNTVNSFYRQKNLVSLSQYSSKIQSEAEKAQNYQEDIQFMQTTLNNYDKKIQKKKKNLEEILDQISLYTKQSVEKQSKCLPLYLRQTSSMSSHHSSRPTDILLKGPKNIIQSNSSFVEKIQQ